MKKKNLKLKTVKLTATSATAFGGGCRVACLACMKLSLGGICIFCNEDGECHMKDGLYY